MDLRPYQLASIEALRAGIRAEKKHQILCAPTGSGKTVMATYLMQEAAAKMSRAAFVVDRVALVDQTSVTFDQFGVDHGVIQGNHWRARPWERIQVVSAQTLARREINTEWQLVIWDECHTLYKTMLEFAEKNPKTVIIGLTATPFTKGLGKVFANVVNVTTTNKLIADGFLAPLRPYVAVAADMTGAVLKFDGEWAEAEMERRGLEIVGDVVSEWIRKTTEHFGGPAKTIVFSATVAHGEELCRQFQSAGFNFQQISYKDGNDQGRKDLINEFRKDDSDIVGLISCEALAKGFDVPGIKIGVSCRPYRKSLSGHIQQMGRVMRTSPGKEYALWLDHAGNLVRFAADTAKVFENGVGDLDDGELDAKVRKEPTDEEKETFTCGACKYLMPAGAENCPACGWERPVRKSLVTHSTGELQEFDMKAKALPGWMQDKASVWGQICYYALDKKQGDINLAEKLALAQYRNLYGEWPARGSFHAQTPIPPCRELTGKIKQQLIAWSRRRSA
ncbi:SSL2 DNA or RNA helicases of superfamily II [uncultured Caudovirales phage]|uniref:SSL2 DNA or RNA helicases of superfamily II n=1 Tax=uncultured Caudovirales phage TaxID=2100421 RepID=A0A6J5PN19_9CAUD|nr:SSL2 DNA or RNA helicases of superfamily II [uncultured Caudovirales phage]CAB4168994.1 SSL2 DNA or RNA helicases of superfamily II [uncultured Caudovirales phage]CAB4180790.1 SSL2 DNA or RNA helicases of superfamily II [uncultured Caudovirales phage]CAB4195611.1 SSL2 DNA or RNA helicases of superfamily II [uncultured Caudovirales phage]CAB4221866.1 SSL2 DNA or RNA helicases of superfamily II [uncultured Caudovirales phage]